MAIEDWRKIREKKGLITYRNSKGTIVDVTFFKEIKSPPASYAYPSRWHVIITSPTRTNLLENKVFKTKSQALKFAKAYMMTHY